MPGIAQCEDSGLLGVLRLANMNSTADQAIPITLSGAGRYIVEKVVVTDAAASLSLAAGGIYTATSKGGTAVVAAAQIYSALTASGKVLSLTMAALTDVLTAATLYLSLTTAQGSAATATLYIFGQVLP